MTYWSSAMKIQHYEFITIAYFICIRAGTQGYQDENYTPEELDDEFLSSIRDQIFFSTPDPPDSPTEESPDPNLLYRQALQDTIKFYNLQDTQMNYTRIHFANVWGAEDEGVRRAVAKLNSMTAFLTQKLTILQNRLNGELSQRERSILPMDHTTIDMLSKGWKEIEKFIDEKCAAKNLTKIQEDELHFLREWLKYSDQELVYPYDAMKDQMEKVLAAEPFQPYTTQSTSTIIFPFSIH